MPVKHENQDATRNVGATLPFALVLTDPPASSECKHGDLKKSASAPTGSSAIVFVLAANFCFLLFFFFNFILFLNFT